MPQAKGDNALPTARAVMDRALDSPKGIRINYGNPKRAHSMRMQCYTVRSRSRARNAKIYEAGHPMYGNSPYDHLELFLEGSWLIIRSAPNIEEHVEELE